MKLYTEEQVRKAHQNGRHGGHNENWYTTDDYIDSLTPIELPSNEEVDKENEKVFGRDYIVDMGTNLKWAHMEAFEVGARWAINRIKEQVKQ